MVGDGRVALSLRVYQGRRVSPFDRPTMACAASFVSTVGGTRLHTDQLHHGGSSAPTHDGVRGLLRVETARIRAESKSRK